VSDKGQVSGQGQISVQGQLSGQGQVSGQGEISGQFFFTKNDLKLPINALKLYNIIFQKFN